jgi:deoxyribonuclease V
MLLRDYICIYNLSMKVIDLHDWQVSTGQAVAIQKDLALRVSMIGDIIDRPLIAGTDISVNKVTGVGTAAIVVLKYPELDIIATSVIEEAIQFPYVPGLLSFRETPLLTAAFKKLTVTPELIMVDGQGIAHPRRLGLASHLGLILDVPTIGCAKSRLCGTHSMPGITRGEYAELFDGSEVIGAAVRTKNSVKPVFVSIGHRIDLKTAIDWVLACSRGYRLPEPTRLAHLAAGGNLKIPVNG